MTFPDIGDLWAMFEREDCPYCNRPNDVCDCTQEEIEDFLDEEEQERHDAKDDE